MIWYALEMIIATIGLAVITLVTRSFFMISDKELPLAGMAAAGVQSTRLWQHWVRSSCPNCS